jgi:hypothetical protein
MRGPWSVCLAVVLVESCAASDSPIVGLRALPSVTNDGQALPVTVWVDGAARVTLSTSLGTLAPSSLTLPAMGAATVEFSCDLATTPGCRGQAVLTADAISAHGAHSYASLAVEVTDRSPGFVDSDAGCGASLPFGPTTACCWAPASSSAAPQCGWVSEPRNVDFHLSLPQPDGGLTSGTFTFSVPEHWVDPTTCVTHHPFLSVIVAAAPTGTRAQLTCAGYGIDLASGAWNPLVQGPCLAGDDFFAQFVCPRLGAFPSAAFAMSNPSVPGAVAPEGGTVFFTVMPR